MNKKRKVEEVKQDDEGNEDEDDSHANEWELLFMLFRGRKKNDPVALNAILYSYTMPKM